MCLRKITLLCAIFAGIALAQPAYSAEVTFVVNGVDRQWIADTTTWAGRLVNRSTGASIDASIASVVEGTTYVQGTFETGSTTAWVTVELEDDSATPLLVASQDFYLASGAIIEAPRPGNIDRVDGVAAATQWHIYALRAASTKYGTISSGSGAGPYVLSGVTIAADELNDHFCLVTNGSDYTDLQELRISDSAATPSVTFSTTPATALSSGDAIYVLPKSLVAHLSQAALASFANTDSGETTVVTGSIAQLAANAVTSLANYATPDNVAASRTLFIEGRRSRSIVELTNWSTGTVTIALDFDSDAALNPGTTIASLDSVTVTNDSDASTTTTSSLAVQQNKRKANFNVAAISSASNHTVEATITTTDGNTLAVTGALRVY